MTPQDLEKIRGYIQSANIAAGNTQQSQKKALEQTRRNQLAGTASALSSRGLLNSGTMPLKTVQYDTATFIPESTKIDQTYQTSIDTMRNNSAKLYNQLLQADNTITQLDAAIAELNAA